MKYSHLFLLIMPILFLVPQPSYSQKKVVTDSLYEKLKKKDINKMTQREYDYFMLMKRKEPDTTSTPVEKRGMLTGVVTYFFNALLHFEWVNFGPKVRSE